MKTVRIGFLGFGVVGQGVWKHMQRNESYLQERLGIRIELAKVVVSNLKKKRDVKIPARMMSLDPAFVLEDDSIDIVCELVGGEKQARDWTVKALKKGKTVVTANKAMICEYGEELFALARKQNTRLFYEASVAGGIPVIKALREGLVANRILNIHGILNGTSNYILTRMEREEIDFAPVLQEARNLGYVEADESLDLDGVDAAHKAVILAYLAFGRWVKLKDMVVEGIRRIALTDIRYAREMGYRIKLLAHIRLNQNGKESISVGVYPTLLPLDYGMAKVDGVFNGVSITGDVLGTTMMVGRGAGQDATASSVISDIADAVLDIRNRDGEGFLQDISSDMAITPLQAMTGRYYIRLKVSDKTGVLAQVAKLLSESDVGVATMIQEDMPEDASASLIFTTHESNEKAVKQAITRFKKIKNVKGDPVLFRIYEGAE